MDLLRRGLAFSRLERRPHPPRSIFSVLVARRALGAWRRSILVRVVTATLLLSMAAVALLGQLVVSQVRDGLLNAKTEAALAHADAGLRAAEQRLAAAPRDATANVGQLLTEIVTELSAQAGTSLEFGVVLLPSHRVPGQPATGRGPRASGGITLSSVPEDLRAAVARNPAGRSYRYVPMHYADAGTVPGIAVGTLLSVPGAADYQLYYLFPLTAEQQTLNLVRRTLATVGVLFVLVLAGVAYVVTRSVVTPVRIAARTAERIAAGSLQERMPERGEDDLARLAVSFNHMTSALQQQIRQLEDLSRLQVRFVSDVSHELRTPLTTVRMAADVLYDARGSFDDQTMARAAELLHNELGRFEALLSDLLEISRFDAGVAVLESEPVDLRRLARRVAQSARPLAERAGSKIRCQLPKVRCVAEVDPRRIERILRNLLTNAVEHGEGRPIVVRVAGNESSVAITVRDHGVGLDTEETSMVFNRFWRADPARARTTGGTGLGLAIAQEDAQLHGGWLQAWGRKGEGTQFRLTVPRMVGGEIDRSPIPLEPTDHHPGVELAGRVRDEA